MIAEPNRHIQRDLLCELLDDELNPQQTDQIEAHLSGCETCRDTLQSIAGEKQWWDETAGVLSKSTLTFSQSAAKQEPPHDSDLTWPLDASLEWIRPLLDESPESKWGRIDHYPIQGLIGQGGMGVVLRGTDPELGRPIAIKILSPHLAGVGAARARFMREARAAAAIVHPSVVPIYSIATAARLPYIVMPCINGGNLQERIDREGPLELAEVLRIGLQIAEGLDAAHRQGVIHRDIKPANILVEEGNGRVLISDFGLARALDDATLTMSGMIAGTPQYMSPEQARGDTLDERSDLFSLGSLLYALSIGRPPFRADSPLAVLRKISESRPRPIQQINEQMPAWFDRIISRLMSRELSGRVATAAEAAKLLSDALAHVRNPSTQPLPTSLESHRRITGMVIAGSLLSAFVGWGIYSAAPPELFSPTTEPSATAPAANSPSAGLHSVGPSSVGSPIAATHLPLSEMSATDPESRAATLERSAQILSLGGTGPASPDPRFPNAAAELAWTADDLNVELAEINRRIEALWVSFAPESPATLPSDQENERQTNSATDSTKTNE